MKDAKYFLLTIFLFLSFFLTFAQTILATPLLSGYSFQKTFYVNGSTAGSVTSYPVKINLYRSTGLDTSTTFYLGTNVLSSFNDIRFTSTDGITLLDYWIESIDSKDDLATVWVMLDSVPASPGRKTFYLFYGNPSATSLSNRTNIFNFYENFDTDGISSWTGSIQNLHSNETATQLLSSDVRVSTPNSANLSTAANCNQGPWDGVGSILSRSINLPQGNYKVEYRVIREITDFTFYTTAIERSLVIVNGSVGISSTTSCNGPGCTVPRNVWGSESFNVVNSPITTIGLEGYSDDCTTGNVWFDDVRIRNFVSPEPEISLNLNGDDSNSNSNSTSNPDTSNSTPSCTDAKPSSAPDLFQINTTKNSAKSFFTPISNTDKFFISFSTKPNAEEHGAEVTLAREGVQNFTVNLLKPNTTYYLKVRGQNGCMPGEWSKILKFKTNSSIFYKK